MRAIWIAGFAAVLPLAGQYTVTVPLRVETSGAAVKNAPYSADATTTTTQVLADGNRIEQSTAQKLYRDSAGRERREESVLAIGALAQPDVPRTITISDPVERVSYSLNPQAHTARRTPGAGMGLTYVGTNKTFTLSFPNYSVTLPNWTEAPKPAAQNAGRQDLGTQTIEGVMAQGTRTTETIPAGQIGNLLPINIVDEAWYSPELKMNILTTHTDPRSGEVVYKLTNINRGEQPQSLFEPPADYTVTGPPAGGGRGGRGPAPANQK